jgi:ABC-type multidrug transport system ATPase subunit
MPGTPAVELVAASQHFVLYPELSVRRNLRFMARLYGQSGSVNARLDELLALVHLDEAEYCDQVVMMRRGGVVAVGSPEALREQAFGRSESPHSRHASFEEVFRRLMSAVEEGAA